MGWPGKNDKSYRAKVSPIECRPSAGFIGAAASPNRETLVTNVVEAEGLFSRLPFGQVSSWRGGVFKVPNAYCAY